MEGAGDERSLSLAEVRAIGGEAGFAPHTLERAIAETPALLPAPRRQDPVKRSGLIWVHFSATRTISVALNGEQLQRVVRMFHPYREYPERVVLDDLEITWRDRKGIQFAVASSAGVTEVRVYVSGFLPRRERWGRWVADAADRLEGLAVVIAGHARP